MSSFIDVYVYIYLAETVLKMKCTVSNKQDYLKGSNKKSYDIIVKSKSNNDFVFKAHSTNKIVK